MLVNGYPNAKKILISADSGGSNSRRSRLWKAELQKLANKLQLEGMDLSRPTL